MRGAEVSSRARNSNSDVQMLLRFGLSKDTEHVMVKLCTLEAYKVRMLNLK